MSKKNKELRHMEEVRMFFPREIVKIKIQNLKIVKIKIQEIGEYVL